MDAAVGRLGRLTTIFKHCCVVHPSDMRGSCAALATVVSSAAFSLPTLSLPSAFLTPASAIAAMVSFASTLASSLPALAALPQPQDEMAGLLELGAASAVAALLCEAGAPAATADGAATLLTFFGGSLEALASASPMEIAEACGSGPRPDSLASALHEAGKAARWSERA